MTASDYLARELPCGDDYVRRRPSCSPDKVVDGDRVLLEGVFMEIHGTGTILLGRVI